MSTIQEIMLKTSRFCSWAAFALSVGFMVYFFTSMPEDAFPLAVAAAATTWIVLFTSFSLWKTEIWWAEELEMKEKEEKAAEAEI